MDGIQRRAGNLGEKSGAKMSLGSRGLEVKVRQERAPCWGAMRLGLCVPGEGGKCYCFQLCKPWGKMGSQLSGEKRAPVR